MGKSTKYISKTPNAQGIIEWTDQENEIWQQLFVRQMIAIQGTACQEYLDGLVKMQFPSHRIPQLKELDAVLLDSTGWQCAAVPALIDFEHFFSLLADKKFPIATFIRSQDEIDYLQEPDVFHEVFGHCAMLTHPAFARFTEVYGQLGKKATPKDRVWLARLYWFTVEFGLLQQQQQHRIYGGGILSSPGETEYVFSGKPQIKPFDIIDVLRTPYRIDIMQPIYFQLTGIDQLFEIAEMDIMGYIEQAKILGLFDPSFPPKQQLAS